MILAFLSISSTMWNVENSIITILSQKNKGGWIFFYPNCLCCEVKTFSNGIAQIEHTKYNSIWNAYSACFSDAHLVASFCIELTAVVSPIGFTPSPSSESESTTRVTVLPLQLFINPMSTFLTAFILCVQILSLIFFQTLPSFVWNNRWIRLAVSATWDEMEHQNPC